MTSDDPASLPITESKQSPFSRVDGHLRASRADVWVDGWSELSEFSNNSTDFISIVFVCQYDFLWFH
jgi:hypothetical protein